MLIFSQDLIGLPVFTKLEQELGKISGFDVDIDTQSIIKYYVKKHSILADLLGAKDLIINQSQVVLITAEKMVVDNTVIESKEAVSRLAREKVVGYSA